MSWSINFRTALSGLRWAWSFYLRYFALIGGVSLVPAAQRLVAQLWKEELPGAASMTLEIVTAAARVLLIGLIIWLAIGRDAELRTMSGTEKWTRVGEFLRTRWLSLVISGGLLTAAMLVFDTLPEALIAALVPAERQPIYWGILLAVKNPTIIAFTFVWWVATARLAMQPRPRPRPELDHPRVAPTYTEKG